MLAYAYYNYELLDEANTEKEGIKALLREEMI